MRPLFALFTLAIAIALGTACTFSANPEAQDKAAVARQQAQYGVAQPIPAFDWSLERDIVIQLYAARNERVATYTVWRSDTGIIEDHCPSIGYPVPYDTSLTNPLKIAKWSGQGGGAVTEQPEPNGIFASKNSIATWVRCVVKVNDKRVEAPIYIESKVTAYPWPVEVDLEKNTVARVEGSDPTVQIKEKTAPAPAPAGGNE